MNTLGDVLIAKDGEIRPRFDVKQIIGEALGLQTGRENRNNYRIEFLGEMRSLLKRSRQHPNIEARQAVARHIMRCEGRTFGTSRVGSL